MRLLIMAVVAVSAGCAGQDAGLRRVGYFQDAKYNRIFTYTFPSAATSDEIEHAAYALPYTRGQLLAAYFYPEGSRIPADGITLAANVFRANEVLYDTPGLSSWRYAFMIPLAGLAEFVDCQATPKNDLCRQPNQARH
jgi:hypothetical protein